MPALGLGVAGLPLVALLVEGEVILEVALVDAQPAAAAVLLRRAVEASLHSEVTA